jgi:cytochrome c553
MKTNLLFLALVATTFASCTSLDRSRNTGDPDVSGQTLALQVCSACHGFNGNSTSPNFPRLAGQQPDYLVAQLKDFRGHKRSDPAGFEYMWGLSRKLTDGQIEQLSDYYSRQQSLPGAPAAEVLMHRGQSIFEQGIPDAGVPACQGCHGPAGRGNGTFPQIARQHSDYVVKQLEVFQRTDERPNGAMMKVVAHALTGEDMTAVAAYLQSMPEAEKPQP